MQDECWCVTKCPHGQQCLGSHAHDGSKHWFPCQKCSPSTLKTIKQLRADIARRRRKFPPDKY